MFYIYRTQKTPKLILTKNIKNFMQSTFSLKNTNHSIMLWTHFLHFQIRKLFQKN